MIAGSTGDPGTGRARTEPEPGVQALTRLDDLTRRLRRECPWDREQDERSIVPHTVEEAYELADAAHSGDDARLLDELGDVLFQVHFLALLLEERGAGSLADVADHCSRKLVRRHPHVFGEVEAHDAAAVLRNWDRIKREEAEDVGADRADSGLPSNLPATIYARKAQRRAAAAGVWKPDAATALRQVGESAQALASLDREQRFTALGELLYAVVGAARELGVDAELALRSAADRRLAAPVEGPPR